MKERPDGKQMLRLRRTQEILNVDNQRTAREYMHAIRIIVCTIQLIRDFRVVLVKGRRNFVGAVEIIVEKHGRLLAGEKGAQTWCDDEKIHWNEVTGPVQEGGEAGEGWHCRNRPGCNGYLHEVWTALSWLPPRLNYYSLLLEPHPITQSTH